MEMMATAPPFLPIQLRIINATVGKKFTNIEVLGWVIMNSIEAPVESRSKRKDDREAKIEK